MSTAKYNYLPFVQRDIIQLTPKVARDGNVLTGAARISALTPNVHGRAILGDLEVLFCYTLQPLIAIRPGNNFLMRLGWSKRGWLTEERYPYNIVANGYRHWWSMWRFPRPYRMYPGDKLRVEYIHDTITQGFTAPFAVGFHGVRTIDNLPAMLSGLDPTIRAGGRFVIDEPALACPKDTPVDISALSISDSGVLQGQAQWGGGYIPPALQVWDSSNRAWFSQQTNFPPGGVTGYENEVGWLSFFATPIILGEERGWVHDEGEELIVDMEFAPLDNVLIAQMAAVVTLRGSLEVEEKKHAG